MPDYRRAYIPGGTYFLTLVTHDRQPLLGSSAAVTRLRRAIREVMRELPFEVSAAVVLPDHVHFLWNLPPGDADYSRRVGKIKVLFTRSTREGQSTPSVVSGSRTKKREGGVWQRRFWEHTVGDERDFEACLNYIHYNPVKHGLVTCPHLWPHSSFPKWVESGLYLPEWGCSCGGRRPSLPPAVHRSIDAGE